MDKRTVIITGGNSGLGYQCAKNIAVSNKNYTVVIACRNLDKAADAQKSLQQETGNSNVYILELDLASLESIRKFNTDFRSGDYPPLYGLVCNAGLNPRGLQHTKDGFEMTFGVNHLGHFLLSNLLLNKVVDDGRIVFVSSDTHEPPKIMPWSAPVFENAAILAFPEKHGVDLKATAMLRYPTSKLCNILCAYEMSERIAKETGKQITVNAFNPGLMPDTNFMGIKINPVGKVFMKGFMNLFGAMLGRLGSSKKSGRALASLITDSKYEHCTAKYYDRGKEVKSSEPSYDKTAARKLWVESAELVELWQSDSILSIT